MRRTFFIKLLFRFQCMAGVRADLESSIDISHGIIHKDAAAPVSASLLSIDMQQTSKRLAMKVVDSDLASRKQLILLQGVNFLFDSFLCKSWYSFALLLAY